MGLVLISAELSFPESLSLNAEAGSDLLSQMKRIYYVRNILRSVTFIGLLFDSCYCIWSVSKHGV